MNILEFIFQDFWHWFGSLILISVPFGAMASMFSRDVNNYYGGKEEGN